jgi:hypothetical protein
MRSHLVVVQFSPFQRGGLVYGLFAAVGTREEVGGTTTGGERVADSFGGERAIFLMSLASVAVAKAVEHQSTARARRAVPLDVGRTVQKVRVQLVVYRPSNEGVLLWPRLIAMV